MEIEFEPGVFGYRWEDLIAHLEALREQHGDDFIINVPTRLPVGHLIASYRRSLELFGHARPETEHMAA